MKPNETSLAIRDPQRTEPWRDPEWQKLWLGLQERPWTTLAICPAGSGVDPAFSLSVSMVLARTGISHLGAPIQVADATTVQLSEVVDFMAEVKQCSARGERVLVALAPVTASPVVVTLAQAVDGVLLCAMLERMSSSHAKQTVKAIGKERFLGTIVFRADML